MVNIFFICESSVAISANALSAFENPGTFFSFTFIQSTTFCIHLGFADSKLETW